MHADGAKTPVRVARSDPPTVVARSVVRAFLGFRRGCDRVWGRMLCLLFARCGHSVRIGPGGSFTFDRIFVGDRVFIGEGAHFSASGSYIEIGHGVMFGPRVMIFTGDHNTGVIGRMMVDVHEKRPEDDQPVIIEDDVWIGAGSIVLKGVRIGRGAVVAAGTLVNRPVPAYGVVAGVPGRLLRMRWTQEQIDEHERRCGRSAGQCSDQ
jgi:acetyltransferase-like isoleucine patch superfamily enzyme